MESEEKTGGFFIEVTKFAKFSSIKNGFLEKWFETHYKKERNVKSFFNFKKIMRLVFMTLILVRV